MKISPEMLRQRAFRHKSQAEAADHPNAKTAHRTMAARFLKQARAESRDEQSGNWSAA